MSHQHRKISLIRDESSDHPVVPVRGCSRIHSHGRGAGKRRPFDRQLQSVADACEADPVARLRIRRMFARTVLASGTIQFLATSRRSAPKAAGPNKAAPLSHSRDWGRSFTITERLIDSQRSLRNVRYASQGGPGSRARGPSFSRARRTTLPDDIRRTTRPWGPLGMARCVPWKT